MQLSRFLQGVSIAACYADQQMPYLIATAKESVCVSVHDMCLSVRHILRF